MWQKWKNQFHGVAGSQSGFPKKPDRGPGVFMCVFKFVTAVCVFITVTAGPITVCVFITAGPITKLFAGGRRRVEDMCYERRRGLCG